MLNIKKRFIVDENNKKLAVEVDIETFEKMEEIIEDYGLFKLMGETDTNEALDIHQAKEYYKGLKKNNDNKIQ